MKVYHPHSQSGTNVKDAVGVRKKDARFFAEHGIVTQHIKDIAINFQKGEKMDDLISRKAAIEALVEIPTPHGRLIDAEDGK